MSKKNKNQAQDCNRTQDNTQNTQEQKKNNTKQQSDQMRTDNSRNR